MNFDRLTNMRDYVNHQEDNSNESGFGSPPRKPSQPDSQDITMKENHWIGNLSSSNSVRQVRLQCRERQYAQVTTITKSQYQHINRTQWIMQDQVLVQPSCLETPIGRQHETEVEELYQQIRRLKTELKKRETQDRSKSKSKTRVDHNDSTMETGNPNNSIYMKEINNKNIEINKLRQSYSVVKSENETLTLIVKEKESEVELLERRLQQVNFQKKRIESYEMAMSQSKSVFKDIQDQMKVLDRQGRNKDKLVEDYKHKQQILTMQLKNCEERTTSLEKCVAELTEERARKEDMCSQLCRQCDEWKKNYVEASRQVEQLPQMEIKLRNSLSTVKDLQERIAQLLSVNEKLKLQFNSQGLKQKKLQQLEIQYQTVLRENREKQDQLDALTEKMSYLEEKLQTNVELQENYFLLQRQLDEKNKESKSLERKLEQKTIIINNQQREIKRISDDIEKFKERNEKIDTIYKENKRLTNLLIDKINQIEQLQIQLNGQESKLASLSNEIIKLTALYEQSSETVQDLNIALEQSKKHYDGEVAVRSQAQDRCEKMVVEITVLTTALNKQKDLTRCYSNDKDMLKKQIDGMTQRLYEEQSKFEIFKSDCESQIAHDRRRIEQYITEVKDLKKKLETITKKQRQGAELSKTVELQKKDLETIVISLQKDYEQSVQDLQHLSRWKQQYLHFMDSFKSTSQMMHSYCQGLQ